MIWGTLTHREDGGRLVKNPQEGAAYREVVLHGESIICRDALTGDPMDIQDLKDGDTIYAWVGPAMTMSLPPHATAILILGNIPADYAVPQFYEISSVAPQALAALHPTPAPTPVAPPARVAHARRGAGSSRSPPSMTVTWPSSWMLAPILRNSST